jgi:hypothetical protein
MVNEYCPTDSSAVKTFSGRKGYIRHLRNMGRIVIFFFKGRVSCCHELLGLSASPVSAF